MFIISQLWLTSHLRSTMVLLDTGTPGNSREIHIEDADDPTSSSPIIGILTVMFSTIPGNSCVE